MRKRGEDLSIKRSMIRGILCYILAPLFLTLGVLCFLLHKNTIMSTQEAFQMMFRQNVNVIESSVLQANYASSTMITFTDYNEYLKEYYSAPNAYEKSKAINRIREMILNTNVAVLGSFQEEMMLIMNDGRGIDSIKIFDLPENAPIEQWLRSMDLRGQLPYWNNELNQLYATGSTYSRKYLVFGRAITRYDDLPLGYVLVRIPESVFFQFGDDPRYQKGTLVLFSQDGRILAGDREKVPEEDMLKIYEAWENGKSSQGRYGPYYVMGSTMSVSDNTVLYIGDYHSIFARSEKMFVYVFGFMLLASALLVGVAVGISRYITRPILFFADRVQKIEQNQPELLRLEENYFQETRALEDGMLRAQKRIQALMEEVRKEAEMKEKARFEALKAQITPHFLFNTLNAIRWKASMNRDDEVADILADLGILLGETYKNVEELERIDNAVHILEAYVKIMQVRFGNNVQFFVVIPEPVRSCQIPRFCLQPLVENSFIHGMSRAEKGVIALRGEMQDGDVVLTLIDNGTGLKGSLPSLEEESTPKKRGITGIGLSNIHRRIQGLFGAAYGLTIHTDVESGFKISLRIPVIQGKEEQDESADRRG